MHSTPRMIADGLQPGASIVKPAARKLRKYGNFTETHTWCQMPANGEAMVLTGSIETTTIDSIRLSGRKVVANL